jgi:hypothetical protein
VSRARAWSPLSMALIDGERMVSGVLRLRADSGSDITGRGKEVDGDIFGECDILGVLPGSHNGWTKRISPGEGFGLVPGGGLGDDADAVENSVFTVRLFKWRAQPHGAYSQKSVPW